MKGNPGAAAGESDAAHPPRLVVHALDMPGAIKTTTAANVHVGNRNAPGLMLPWIVNLAAAGRVDQVE